MKVLILVLSARRTPWASMMDLSQQTWDAEVHPQTQTLYYCGKSDRPATPTEFYSPKFDESLEHIAPRTMEAFEKSLELEWDVMARTHSSTYVHKRNLVDFIQTAENPKENFLCGLLTTGPAPFLWGGGSYIMSRDVIEKFVANKHEWRLNVMEDNAITDLANQLDIPFTPGRMASINRGTIGWFVMTYGTGEPFNFEDWSDVKKLHPHYYIRCKHDPDRKIDLVVMKELHKHYH